jgi:3-oxoacyl-[acyl-carrier protein] reductase
VLRLASLGANVVVNYSKDKVAADEVVAAAEKLGVKALLVQADVSSVSEIAKLFDITIKTFGKIDVVVANAGIEKVNIPVNGGSSN